MLALSDITILLHPMMVKETDEAIDIYLLVQQHVATRTHSNVYYITIYSRHPSPANKVILWNI